MMCIMCGGLLLSLGYVLNPNSDLCRSFESARSGGRGETAVRHREGTGGSALEHGSLACLYNYYVKSYEDENHTIKPSLVPTPSYQSTAIRVR